MKPYFSILICTVGKENLTRGAIGSIVNQGFSDIEIIVTDTSGSDIVQKMVVSYNDPRIRFFEVPDLDPTIAWEYAYEQSTGRYILWYDDDNRLVPWSLKHFAHLIETEKADIVSANHVYYLGDGNRHEPSKTNTLSALFPFTLTTKVYEKEHALRAVYDFRMGTADMPRWHSAATFISRDICEKARAEVGYFIAPHTYGNFTFHPLMFEYAHKPIYDDRPVCIIGKFGSSITQQWSNTFTKVRRSTAEPYRYTGVSERSLGNTTSECYLRVQHDLPRHQQYPFNWNGFYLRYSSEMMYTNLPLLKHLRAWRELIHATERLDAVTRKKVRRIILRRALFSLGIHVTRTLGLWDTIRLRFKKRLPENPDRKLLALDRYDIHSIDQCAQKLAIVFEKEWGLPITPSP